MDGTSTDAGGGSADAVYAEASAQPSSASGTPLQQASWRSTVFLDAGPADVGTDSDVGDSRSNTDVNSNKIANIKTTVATATVTSSRNPLVRPASSSRLKVQMAGLDQLGSVREAGEGVRGRTSQITTIPKWEMFECA